MAPKRKEAAEADAVTAEEGKRYRQVMNEMADELVCPITQELPMDPVMADDGRVYERQAMEEWLRSKAGQAIRSPVTNEPMGKKLLPAVQVRNTIKGMVTSGAISGDKAEAWKKRIEEEEEVAKMRRRAEDGVAGAMDRLGAWYRNGRKGLAVDYAQAVEWFKRGADLDDARCTVALGQMYAEGKGTARDDSRALVLISRATGLGSAHACYLLGFYYSIGHLGLPKDPKETTARWYRKAQACAVQDSANTREEVANWLREHPDPAQPPPMLRLFPRRLHLLPGCAGRYERVPRA